MEQHPVESKGKTKHKLKPIEIRLAYNLPGGNVAVHTGCYFFAHCTLEQIAKTIMDAEPIPDFIEMDIAQFQNDDD